MVLEQLDISSQKRKESWSKLICYIYNTELKMDYYDLNIKDKTQLLGENIVENLYYLVLSDKLLDMTSKVQPIK